MDLTPDLLVGAALGARVRPPLAAMGLAFGGHLVLDAIPHLDFAWISGNPVYEIADFGIGVLFVLVVFLRVRSLWVLVGALCCVLPDAPGLKRWEQMLPHGFWPSPWGTGVEVVVAGLGFLCGVTAVSKPRAHRASSSGS